MSYLDYLKVKESPTEILTRKTALYSLFDRIGQELEMPAARYQEATKRFQSVSDWLHECPVLGHFNPNMFAQGSFALGTTVRPLHGDEYDLDFIGHGGNIRPRAFTDGEVNAFQGEATVENAAGTVRLKRECRCDGYGFTFNRQRAADFKASCIEAFDGT